MRHYRHGAHTKSDLKVHIVWIPKYRKKVLVGDVAVFIRDLLRKIAMEHDLIIISGKVAKDHVHLFLSYRPNQSLSKMVQWLKGTSSRVLMQEFPHMRKQFWGRHFWARGYLAVSSGNIMDDMIKSYIDEQEGEQIAEDSRFAYKDGTLPDVPHLSDRYFKRAIKRAGVPEIRFHDLRTTYASNFVMSGGDIFVLSKLLGHTSVKMTAEKYAALHPQFMKDAVETVQFGRSNKSALVK